MTANTMLAIMNRDRLVFALQSVNRYFRAHREFCNEDMGTVPQDTIALILENCDITDDALRGATHLTSLRCLDLDSTAITDLALGAVASLPALEELWLECTAVTDEGLRQLHACRVLRFLSVVYTGVSAAGVADLKSAVPDVEISQ